jgi:hypothetical protein
LNLRFCKVKEDVLGTKLKEKPRFIKVKNIGYKKEKIVASDNLTPSVIDGLKVTVTDAASLPFNPSDTDIYMLNPTALVSEPVRPSLRVNVVVNWAFGESEASNPSSRELKASSWVCSVSDSLTPSVIDGLAS